MKEQTISKILQNEKPESLAVDTEVKIFDKTNPKIVDEGIIIQCDPATASRNKAIYVKITKSKIADIIGTTIKLVHFGEKDIWKFLFPDPLSGVESFSQRGADYIIKQKKFKIKQKAV